MKRTLLVSLLSFSLMSFAGVLLAKDLDVDTILDLLRSHVSETSIEKFVERNHFTVNLTADDLMDLKKAGASDQLIEFLQEQEAQAMQYPSEGSQTAPAAGTEGEGEGYGSGTGYSSSSVYFGFGLGFGYPYAYYPYYYPYYYGYYPAYYPYPYPCHYHGYYGGYYPGGHYGTGVYSYWYRGQNGGRPLPPGSGGGASMNGVTGHVLRPAPSSPMAPQIHGSRGLGIVTTPPHSTPPHSMSAPSHPFHSSPGGVVSHGFHGGMSGGRGFGGGFHGGGHGRR